MSNSVYSSPAIPAAAVGDSEEFLARLLANIDLARADDAPLPKDLVRLLNRYNSSLSDRDLIDEVFVLLTGWTLATLVAKTVDGTGYESLLASWRRQCLPMDNP